MNLKIKIVKDLFGCICENNKFEKNLKEKKFIFKMKF